LTDAVGQSFAVTGISRVEKVTLTDGAEVNGIWKEPGTVIYVPSIWLRDNEDWREIE
jgi:hypothetical protein